MLIRDSGNKLTITDFPQREAFYALIPFFAMMLASLKIIPPHPIYAITAAVFLLVYLYGARFCSAIFDRGSRKIFWKKVGFFKSESGECTFEQVKEIAIGTTDVEDSSKGKHYRIVLCLEARTVPLTDTYQYGREKTLERLELLGKYSGIQINLKILEIEQK
ncbi:hypothetical protein KA183_08825 [bacterium]|nr:hypothetical protein [bacterium]QQR56750.1 MAG: hypothetical protein IPG59_17370 [Candidatus Melainabacteria bacterium]